MDEPLSLTALRKRLYEIVDRVLATGLPAVVERRGRRVLIVPEDKISTRLGRLKKRSSIVGDPDDLVELKVAAWHESENLPPSI